MNQEQVTGTIRSVLLFITGYATAQGWIDNNMAIAITAFVLAGIPLAWSLWANSHKQQILAVAAIPNVDKVVLKDPVASNAIPSDKVIAVVDVAPQQTGAGNTVSVKP